MEEKARDRAVEVEKEIAKIKEEMASKLVEAEKRAKT
jgi:hypothetical protein